MLCGTLRLLSLAERSSKAPVYHMYLSAADDIYDGNEGFQHEFPYLVATYKRKDISLDKLPHKMPIASTLRKKFTEFAQTGSIKGWVPVSHRGGTGDITSMHF